MAKDKTQPQKPWRDEVAEEMIRHIEAGTAPWQKPWTAGVVGQHPFNPVTGKPYKGVNNLWLSMRGYDDPRWLTYNQAQALGAQVRKGERSSTIEYWKWSERTPMHDEAGHPLLDGDGRQRYQDISLARPQVFYAKVFNAQQIDGLEPYKAPEPTFEPLAEAERLLASSGIQIRYDQSDRAFYSPLKDEIHMPARAAFPDAYEFYSTALHEAGHGTGHRSRMDREFGPFGSEVYAREELRAEMASYMVGRELGIGHFPERHASYLAGWVKVIKDDRNALFQAARDAEQIATWIKEPEQRLQIEQAMRAQRTEVKMDNEQAVSSADRVTLQPTEGMKALEASFIEIASITAFTEQEQQLLRNITLDGLNKLSRFNLDSMDAFNQREESEGREALEHWAETRHNQRSQRFEDAIRAILDMRTERADGLEGPPTIMAGKADMLWEEARKTTLHQWRDYVINPSNEAARLLREEAAQVRQDGMHFSAEFGFLEGQEVEKAVQRIERTAEYVEQLSNLQARLLKQAGIEKPQHRVTKFVAGILEKAAEAQKNDDLQRKSKIWLQVPFKEKEAAKAAGARWDGTNKSWYVSEGHDLDSVKQWRTSAAPSPRQPLSPADGFAAFLREHGVVLKSAPVMDGAWHRAPLEDDKPGVLTASYRGFADGRPNGQLKTFKDNQLHKWVGGVDVPGPAERQALQAEAKTRGEQRKQDLLTKQQAAAEVAADIWSKAMPAQLAYSRPDMAGQRHPYLAAKDVDSHGLKMDQDGRLLVPCRDIDGKLHSLQSIDKDGTKLFLAGGRQKAVMFVIDPHNRLGKDTAIICEGYATGATLHERAWKPVVIAFNAGNLLPVAQALRDRYPDGKFAIAADNDHKHEGKPIGNVGILKAQEAAQAIGAQVLIPDLLPHEKEKGLTDWNDLAKQRGKNEVSGILAKQLDQAPAKQREPGLFHKAVQFAKDGIGL